MNVGRAVGLNVGSAVGMNVGGAMTSKSPNAGGSTAVMVMAFPPLRSTEAAKVEVKVSAG